MWRWGHCLLVPRPHNKRNVFPGLRLARKEASPEGGKSFSVFLVFFSIIFLSCIGMILKI